MNWNITVMRYTCNRRTRKCGDFISLSKRLGNWKDSECFGCGDSSGEYPRKRERGLGANCNGKFDNLVSDPDIEVAAVLPACTIMKPHLQNEI
jgi:hypothetical protein